MASLKKHLALTNIPKRMECFDISNIRGKQAGGSMVTFESGKPVRISELTDLEPRAERII